MKKVKRIVVWFRKDLRLHDNEALHKAIENSEEIIPIYVFNKEEFSSKTIYHFSKTGAFRTQFLLESVQHLKNALQQKGIDLVIRIGNPEEEVFKLVQEVGANGVHANMERTQDDVRTQNALEKKLWSLGVEITFFRGKMLYYTQDLPFPVAHTPDNFNAFRKEVEKFIPVRTPFPQPTQFSPWTIPVQVGEMPNLQDLEQPSIPPDTRADIHFIGGEAIGLERLNQYFSNRYIDNFEEQHHDLSGLNNSSKLSPYLAMGCISPKYVYAELKKYETKYGSNKSTQAFALELLWRDYYRLIGKKYIHKIFEKGGILGRETLKLDDNWEKFNAWVNGQTPCDLVNACMLQLKNTGFLSHKGRQLVSSYLVHDLKVNWHIGAAYFQHILIDYDVCSNWVNWNIVGGVGPDSKEDRYINIENQAKKLDPKGEYTDEWLKGAVEEV